MPYDSEDAYSDDSRSSSSGVSSTSSSGRKDKARAVSGALKSMGDRESDRASSISSSIRPVSYKKGGRVKRTGLARLHKDEYVVPRGKVKRMKKAVRKSGMRMKGR